MTIADLKRRFSEVVNRVRFQGERVLVVRRRTPVAALVTLDDLQMLEPRNEGQAGPRRGLLAALGAWEEMDGFDEIIDEIYRARDHATDRQIALDP
jgi:prevent-host-death family protein